MAKIGERIGTYEITRLLGSGGMAMVYAARHTSIGTDHALKVLLPNYANNPRTVERFRQEARAQFRMRHPNIVQVTDFVDDGENLALVMDLIQGMTLAAAMQLRPGPWPVADVVAVMRPVLEAMTYAHREGLDGAAVVHRDLKPENVMLDLQREHSWPGVPKVMDFGIAKVLGASNVATATNARMGTPGYMSPEQFKNAKDAEAPADVWALGVMLWQLLAGRLPVDPDSNLALVKLYEGLTPIPRLTQVVPGIPQGLSEAVAQAMALDPGDRFADAAPLLRAVELGVARAKPVVQGWEIQRAAEELAKKRALDASDLPPPLPIARPKVSAVLALPDLPPWPEGSGELVEVPGSVNAQEMTKATVPAPRGGRLVAILVALLALVVLGVASVVMRLDQRPDAESVRAAEATATVTSPGSEHPVGTKIAPRAAMAPEGMALIPSGSFKMGCVPGDLKCQKDEQPQHTVSLSAFNMDVYEVTVAKYAACVDAGFCTVGGGGANLCNWGKASQTQHPMNCVNWWKAEAYCRWAGSRLPTEAEWEKASRGGLADKAYPWGDEEPTCRRAKLNTAVFSEDAAGCGKGATWVVGSGSSQNGYGLHDLSGNVAEWVKDGPAGGSYRRVARGGSFEGGAADLRSSGRLVDSASGFDENLGFRCARSAL